MSVGNLDNAKVILKNHYDKQQKVVDASGVQEDILWVKMKYAHSIDVFNISEYLIDNDEELQKLTDEQKLYGKLSALLHDIGRAYEIGDMKSKVKPHGYYGADVILKQMEKETNPFILIPVKYHGDLYAEENARNDLDNINNLSNEDKDVIIKLLYLVMDSDKLSNFKLFKQIDEGYFLGKKKELYITDECFESFLKKQLVKREDMNTIFDEFIFYIGWCYDLNFNASKKMILENNLMQTFIDKFQEKINLVKTSATNEQIEKIQKQFEVIKKQIKDDKLI